MSDMRALAYLVVLGLVFYVVWRFLGRNAGPKAKLGPDGTNVREPETFVVHHHGKEQGLEIANAAKAPIPGRDDVELAEDLLPEQRPRSSRQADAPPADAERGRVIMFRGRPDAQPASSAGPEEADIIDDPIQFTPDTEWTHEMAEEVDWEGLNDPIPLPSHYTEEAITALVRNPRSLYVYWERSAYADQNLLGTLGEDAYRRSTPCLRVVDVTPGIDRGQLAAAAILIDVSDLDDHWFVQDGIEPDHMYEVSYGRRTADGQYIVLSHALPVRTPHESPAPEVSESMLYRQYVTQPGGGGSTRSQPGSQPWR
ncbi:MAG: hypothetical protein K0R39_2181 [Symbiobacteriaceae bacterium]|jgi:hypothetical protein|nr:hypothetical protein [Symbiobacteriaceae bacterium]